MGLFVDENGCTIGNPPPPDLDGDGVPDSVDACPDMTGSVQWSGCPDSDGDGLPDNLDLCPQDYATTPDGCPANPDPVAGPDAAIVPYDALGNALPFNVNVIGNDYDPDGGGVSIAEEPGREHPRSRPSEGHELAGVAHVHGAHPAALNQGRASSVQQCPGKAYEIMEVILSCARETRSPPATSGTRWWASSLHRVQSTVGASICGSPLSVIDDGRPDASRKRATADARRHPSGDRGRGGRGRRGPTASRPRCGRRARPSAAARGRELEPARDARPEHAADDPRDETPDRERADERRGEQVGRERDERHRAEDRQQDRAARRPGPPR